MPSTSQHAPFAAYSGNQPYLFVSYAHLDAGQVFPDLVSLNRAGVRIWYDEGIDPGTEWPDEIAKAIENCSAFVVFVSDRSVQSTNVRNEINFALDLGKTILTIYISDTSLPSGLQLRLGNIQAIMKHRMDADRYQRQLQKSIPTALWSAEQRGPISVSRGLGTGKKLLYGAAGLTWLLLMALIVKTVFPMGHGTSSSTTIPSSTETGSPPAPGFSTPKPPTLPGHSGSLTPEQQAAADQLLVGLWAPDGILSNHRAGFVTADAVRNALDRGANPDARNSDFNETTLGYAAHNDLAPVVEVLIKAGAAVDDAGDKNAYTPLMDAAVTGALDCGQLLLEQGANANFTNGKGQSPLIIAASYCHPEFVRLLLSKGANAKQADAEGHNALFHATNPEPYYGKAPSERDKASTVRELTDAGAPP